MSKRFNRIIIFLLFIISTSHAQISLNDAAGSNVSSMMALQQISVTIGGEFIVNGSFPASATERVDQFVTRIYNLYRFNLLGTTVSSQNLNKLIESTSEYPKRGIILKRSNDLEIILDLESFHLDGDFSKNPYLQNDDVIIFPQIDWERNFIEVEGAVNKPLQFQYVEGDKLSDALLFARGINLSYTEIEKIEITRLSYDGMNESIVEVSINENPLLQRGDRIRVIAKETQKKDFKVLVDGEVNKPGYIYITKDQTTIKEVIEKAGGFRENADLSNSELIRNPNVGNLFNLPYQDRRRSFSQRGINRQIDQMMMIRMADIETEDSLSLIYDNQLRTAKAIVTVDFSNVLDENSDNSKFIVKDGDIIFIPEITNLVYIFGQVMNPGYIDFNNDKDYKYYIEMAGGVGNRAKDEVYLIKSKTRAWIDMTDANNNYEIESGDYIWIPKDIPRNSDYYLARVSQIAGIIGSVATVVLLLIQIGK